MLSIKRLKQIILPVLALMFGAFSCTTEEFTPTTSGESPVTFIELGEPYLEKARIETHISVGSPDICAAIGQPQGCDANFSLTANIDVNGAVKGQYHDQLKGVGSIHASIDCVAFYGTEGEIALISGVITKGAPGYEVGDRVSTIAIDGDAAGGGGQDYISYSYAESATFDCNVPEHGYAFLALTAGQVVIK